MTPAYLAHVQKTLADIEAAGLFKRERVDDQSTELLIFITPRIIKG